MKGKAFGELPVVGKEDDIYCNLPENVLGWENEVLFCPDPLYGILYYVDHGGDNMIHAVYNGQSQVVVELPGKRLFCRGGKLYFLIETFYGFKLEGALNGNIVEYDPLTGDVTILAKEQFNSMVVYQDLIYCRQDMQSHQGEEGMYGYSPCAVSPNASLTATPTVCEPKSSPSIRISCLHIYLFFAAIRTNLRRIFPK